MDGVVDSQSIRPERTKARTICRACHVSCSLIVEMEDNRPVKLYGDKDNPISHGFSCIRGRELADYETIPTRLQSSVERGAEGGYHPISSDEVTSRIAAKLNAIIAEHGPRAVSAYAGGFCLYNSLTYFFLASFMQAIGSPMFFTPETIDQPGKATGPALHGRWLGGVQRLSEGYDTVLLIGTNPLVSATGPFGESPAHNLHLAKKKGTKLIVCDPRRTETARQADIYMQSLPGEDAAILAGIIAVILNEELYDVAFVAAEADGLDALRAAVQHFTPEYAAARAGIEAQDLVSAARCYAQARRGLVHMGTGPNMSGHSTLVEYLGRVLTTICGHWPRAGEEVSNPGVLIQFPEFIAATPGPVQAYDLGEKLRVHGLAKTVAGMPTAALTDEILMPGEGQVRAFINIGGNPMVSFPDQERTFQAMQSLELLVCVDPHMSTTARVSHYVLAPTLSLETAAVSSFWELAFAYGTIYGYDIPYQQFTPAIVAPPAGADVLEDWQYIYKIAQKMGLQLVLPSASTSLMGSDPVQNPAGIVPIATVLDMSKDMSTDEAWACIFKGSPVPFDEVKSKAHGGHIFDLPKKRILPKPAGWTGRFDIGNQSMMAQLISMADGGAAVSAERRPFRLISRRLKDVFNSCWVEHEPLQRKWRANPAFMNPGDMAAIGLKPGDIIRITSDRSYILGVVELDANVKAGCISMSHGWGTNPNEQDDPRRYGGTTSRLCDTSKDCDPYTWMPLMSAIPVTVTAEELTPQFN